MEAWSVQRVFALCLKTSSSQALTPLTCGSWPGSLILPPPCISRDLDPFDFTVFFWGILNYSGSQMQGPASAEILIFS